MKPEARYLQILRATYSDVVSRAATVQLRRGQFNDVLLIDGALVFRFPRSPQAAQTLATETQLLHALHGRLPLPIPQPISVPDAAAGGPSFVSYRMIGGEPLRVATLATIDDAETLHRLATQLGTFLRALHAVPVADLGLELPLLDQAEHWAALHQAFRDDLFGSMRPDARAQVDQAFAAFLGDSSHFTDPPVLRHGDFGGTNILYDPHARAISGVIDFGAAGLGDPAVDLAAISWYGPSFLESVFLDYPQLASAAIRARARFYQSTHALQQALWARRTGDQEAFADGIARYV